MNLSPNLLETLRKIREANRLHELGNPDGALKLLREFRREGRYDDETKELIDSEIVNASARRVTKLRDHSKFREACSASLDDLGCYYDDFDEECKLGLKNNAAMTLLSCGEHSISYKMLKEVVHKQLQLLGPNHGSTLITQSNLANALGELGKYEDALKLYKDTLERMDRMVGDHPNHLKTFINMAVVLTKAGRPEEALKRLKVAQGITISLYGSDHDSTLMVQNNLAKALLQLKRFPEALKLFTRVLNKRMENLGPNHPLTLDTQGYLGRVIFQQGKYLEALKTYYLVSEKYKTVLGDSHPDTLRISQAIEMLKRRVGSKQFTELQNSCKKTDEGSLVRLHDLINSGDKNGVKDLLADGLVDITQVTAQKGNTPLHIAVNKNNTNIVENLLEHAKKKLTPNEMVKFIDAKTSSAVGNTAMHIAASNGSLKPMKALLRYGATYSIKNKKGNSPIDQANDPKIKSLLGMIAEMFEAAKRDDPGVISKLKALDKDELLAVTNAKNDQGYSLHQVSKTKSLSAEFSKLSV